MIQIDREQLAWAAGIFEGEGSISVSGSNNRNHIGLQMGSTDYDVVATFYRIVGVGHIYGPYVRGVNRKPLMAWQTGKFEDAQATLAMLWPWLHERRQATVVSALKTWHERRRVAQSQSN